MSWDISLSPSKLNKFNECPRCFWDMVKLDINYRGIMATLMGGVDRVLKEHYDHYRDLRMLPAELIGQLPRDTFLYGTNDQMKKMRHWKSNPLKPIVKTRSGSTVSLIMAFDDLLEGPNGISPFDAKSKGAKPKYDGSKFYLTQLDIYYLAGVLEKWKMSGVGYLAYYYPESFSDGSIKTGCEVYELKLDANRALDTIERAVACLNGGQPDYNSQCELCRFSQIRVEAAVKTIAQPATAQALAQV